MKPLAQNTMIQGRYLIIQMIGKGGMGEVYLAVDQRLGSAVALKRTFFAGDETLGNAFEREARILARMRHPVLPKVSDHFAEGDEQYLVMEHISGDDLSKRLEVAQKPFPLTWVMFWADQLLDALSYLHSHEPPIIHRDIKPQNLKLTDENHIILLDFGLSKSSTGNTVAPVGSNSSGSTASVVGYTPHYAPMEQIRGIGTNPRSDLYSLSATLYQLLTNIVPPDALSRADSLINGEEDPISPLGALNSEIPEAVSDVILKAMEISQEKRYETAKEMQKALRKAYASMQNAMTAQTVAFNVNEQPEAVASTPIEPSMDKTEVMQFGINPIPADAVSASQPEPVLYAEAVPDLDATIAFDPGSVVEPKQSDLKTEVFLGGSIPSSPYSVPEQESSPYEQAPYSEPQSPAYENDIGGEDDLIDLGDDFSVTDNTAGQESFSPDATMPMIAFQQQNNETFSAGANDAYAVDDYTIDDDDDEIPRYEPLADAAAASSASSATVSDVSAVTTNEQPTQAKKKGSGGKIAAIFGGLFLLFVVALGAIGGGYYYFNVYSANVVADPTPTPDPTPSPEQTVESEFDSNSNTDSNFNSESNSDFDSNTNTNSNTNSDNSNSDIIVDQPPPTGGETKPRQPSQQPPSRQGQRNPPNRTPSETRPAPAPTRDRTIILQ